jgi:hypothetical protein
VTADYRRQEDELHGDLTQSVYVSGFQEIQEKGGQNFGWYFGATPFEQYVSPGIRSAFAIIVVPRTVAAQSSRQDGTGLRMHMTANWTEQDNPKDTHPWYKRWHSPAVTSRDLNVSLK